MGKVRIAIVGTGAAGISVLRELVNQVEDIKEHSLTVYSDERLFGTGLPYQKDDEVLLLNQFAETMSLIPDEPLHFAHWIKKQYGIKETSRKFFPRVWYGEYLQYMLNKWREQSGANVNKQNVLSVTVTEENKYLISTEEDTEEFDMVHLALGHLAYQDPYQLKGTKGYVHVPYPTEKVLQGIEKNKHVGILGTGLTSIDLMLYVKKQFPEVNISFFSPEGTFAAVRGEERKVELIHFTETAIQIAKAKNGGCIPLETIKNWFIQECHERGIHLETIWEDYGLGTVEGLQFDLDHLQEIGAFQSIIHSMTDLYAELWNGLTNGDRVRFVEKYAKRFTDFRSPLPEPTAQKIVEYVKDGSVSIYGGIRSIEKANEKFTVGLEENQNITVDVVLNGTGQQKNLSEKIEMQQPLIQQLINERIIVAYSFGGVQVTYPEMSVLSDRYGQLDTLKLYGQLTSGVDYMNNTIELISKSAIRGVRDIVRFMH